MPESVQTVEGCDVQSCRRIGSVWPPCELPHSVATIRPTAGRRPRQKARGSSAGLCSKLRIPRGSPACSRSSLQRAALQTRLRIAAHGGGRLRMQILLRKQLQLRIARGNPCLQQRQLAGCHCRLVCCEGRRSCCARSCWRVSANTAAVLQSCEFFGEALACNVSFQIERAGLPAIQDPTADNSAEFLKLF